VRVQEVSMTDIAGEEHHPIPKVVKQNSLQWMHNQIYINIDKLNHVLLSSPDFQDGKEVKAKLEEIMDKLGLPADRIGKKGSASHLKD
jgi:hypothetical protein